MTVSCVSKTALISTYLNASSAVTCAKEILNYNRDHTVEESLNYAALWNSAMNFSDDMMEAFKSKTEKRDSDFQGLVKKRKYLED